MISSELLIMLRITVNKSASAAKKYYSELYYSEGQSIQSYYSEKDQSIGTWNGKAAYKLNLNGKINKEDFASLCDNKIPCTNDQLTKRNSVERRVGYDFTFNASKSVSLAYTFADDNEKKQILQAFRDSVKDAMDEVENGVQARVRKNKANENRETGNIVYGEFIHFTSRPVDNIPDPHLHAHCFVFNATFDEAEDKWKAVQFGQVKQDAPYYEAVFHSSLAERLNGLGYEIEKTKNGFEISGISRETIDKFSRRTEEIENVAKEYNITDKQRKSDLGVKTREDKRNSISEEQQYTAWQDRLTEQELINLTNLKKPSVADEKKKDFSMLAKDAVDYSLDHHLERKSVATDKEILTTALRSSFGEVRVNDVKKAFQNNQEIISVSENSQTWITTKDALNEENALITKACENKGNYKPINDHYTPSNPLLSKEQHNAVQHALNSIDGIIIMAGKAGTGKTTLMKEVQSGIYAAGKNLYAFAPSAEASRMVQRKEGFQNAETLATLFQNKTLQTKLKNSVIWIDEAGMLSNKDMSKAIDIANEQNSRIILTGDIKQHNSIERGDALRTLQIEAGITSIQISKIQRQKSKTYKEAVFALSQSDINKGFRKLEKMGAITEVQNTVDRVNAIAEDYYTSTYQNTKKGKNENEVLVVSPTHHEGEMVTQKIREKLKQQGFLNSEEKSFTTFKNLQLTAAEKVKKENYNNDKWLIFHQNVKGFAAGSKYKIENISDNNFIRLSDSSGELRSINIDQAANFNVFEQKSISIATGDKIRITGNGKAKDGKHLFNGNLYKVSGFDRQGNIKLSNGSTISKDYGYISLGYVLTSHASQGKTVDKVIISQSSMSFRASSKEQFYVSVSRGRKAVSIYTDDKVDLLHSISKSNQRTSAIELTRKKIQDSVIEINRNNILKSIREKATIVVDKLKITINKMNNYELHR